RPPDRDGRRPLARLPRQLDGLARAAPPARRRTGWLGAARADGFVVVSSGAAGDGGRGPGLVPLAAPPRPSPGLVAALAGPPDVEHRAGLADALRAGRGARDLRFPRGAADLGAAGTPRLAARPGADPGSVRAYHGPRLGRGDAPAVAGLARAADRPAG